VTVTGFFEGRTPDPLVGGIRAAAFVRENPGYPMKALAPWRSRSGLAQVYAPVFERAHWKVYDWLRTPAYRRRWSPFGLYARAAWAAVRRARPLYMPDLVPRLGADFDVFHSCYGPLPPRSVTGKVPRVITIFDMIPVIRPDWVPVGLTREFERVLASIDTSTDWVVTISEHSRKEFLAWTGMTPERVRAIPLAGDETFRLAESPEAVAAVRRRYAIPPGPYVLSVAAQQPRKNLGKLVEAFDLLLRSSPGRRETLVLVGVPWLTADVRRSSSNVRDVDGRIIFTGHVPDDDLRAIYSGASCFVFPSLYEGFGLPLLEAMQCGTPVVSSDATSLPEVGGDAVHWVDARDPSRLCAAIREVLDHPELRERLRRDGLERARHFNWAKTAAASTQLYRDMLAASRGV
jgi:glycosyltransferase involved in cell wall biosynthesis